MVTAIDFQQAKGGGPMSHGSAQGSVKSVWSDVR